MTLAYKVEELLALRDSVSESAVSIERFADEDVIKEHVLRPSVSACAIGAHSDSSSRLPVTAPVLASTANKRPSPSPSVKRGKAERLLKEHGSPPGMRVTAGGRVVPSDLPPLSNSRSPHFNPRAQSSRISPINPMPPQQVPDLTRVPTNAQIIYNTNGQPCLYINNQILPIPGLDFTVPGSASNQHALYPSMPLVSDHTKQFGDTANPSPQNALVPYGYPPSRKSSTMNLASAARTPTPASELQILKQQHALKSKELKLVEQTEVLQSNHQNEEWRNAIIKQKRKLIIEIDSLRKQIKTLEANAPKGAIKGAMQGSTTAPLALTRAPPVSYAPQFQQPIVQQMYPNVGLPMTAVGAPPSNPYASPFLLYPPYAGTSMLSSETSQISGDGRVFTSAENSVNGNNFVNTISTMSSGDLTRTAGRENANQSPTGPGSAFRRSHAIEIKPPRDDVKMPGRQGSALDPKSPTYEPFNTSANTKIEGVEIFVPPTPSPIPSPVQNDTVQAECPWLFDDNEGVELPKEEKEERFVQHKPSISSVSTADFFPTNTHEHSSTRLAPAKAGANTKPKNLSEEKSPAPTTPEKQWPSSPWNPVSRSGGKSKVSNLSIQASPLRKLTSWNQEFGSKSDGSQPTSKHGTPQGESNETATETPKPSAQQTDAGQEWSLVPAKAVDHVPSTYQEGYQAGISHKGLPDDPEVIRGYHEGLTVLLKDGLLASARNFQLRNVQSGSTNSKSSSFRANPFGTSPNDSAVSLSFSARSGDQPPRSQENIRAVMGNSMLSAPRLTPAHSPTGSIWGANQGGVPVPYSLTNEAMGASKAPQRTSSIATNSQGIRAYTDSSQMVPPRQIPGNQVVNKIVGTPISQQRYYPGHKDYKPGTSNGASSSARAPDQRFSSGFDGAMDDMVEMTKQSNINTPPESTGVEASCFKSSSAKGKQKASPTKTSESPKKSGETSPAKNLLKQIANKDKKPIDPANLSPEAKRRWRNQWRRRFEKIKIAETEQIEQYKREN